MCPEAALCLAHTPYSDLYSLAALVYAVFTRGGTVFNCSADWYAYKKAINEVRERGEAAGWECGAGTCVLLPLMAVRKVFCVFSGFFNLYRSGASLVCLICLMC